MRKKFLKPKIRQEKILEPKISEKKISEAKNPTGKNSGAKNLHIKIKTKNCGPEILKNFIELSENFKNFECPYQMALHCRRVKNAYNIHWHYHSLGSRDRNCYG